MNSSKVKEIYTDIKNKYNGNLDEFIKMIFDISRETIECKALYDSTYEDDNGGCICRDGCNEYNISNIEEFLNILNSDVLSSTTIIPIIDNNSSNNLPLSFENWFDEMSNEEAIKYLKDYGIYYHDQKATIDDWKEIYKNLYLK